MHRRRIDTDNSRSIDMDEFEQGLSSEPALRKKLSKVLRVCESELSGACRQAMQVILPDVYYVDTDNDR